MIRFIGNALIVMGSALVAAFLAWLIADVVILLWRESKPVLALFCGALAFAAGVMMI